MPRDNMPPQIEPPRGCRCTATLGRALRSHRFEDHALASRWHGAGNNGNATMVLLYGTRHTRLTRATHTPRSTHVYTLPYALAERSPTCCQFGSPRTAFIGSGRLPDGSLTSQVTYAPAMRDHTPTLAEPVLGTSFSSLARVTASMSSKVAFMPCPSLPAIVGDTSRTTSVPGVDEIVPCEPAPATGGCFTVVTMQLQNALLDYAASKPGVRHALVIETDQLWLGHPLGIFARYRHHHFPIVWARGRALGARRDESLPASLSLDDCDVTLTVHPTGGLNSGVLLLRTTEPVRRLWRRVLDATIRRVSRDGCLGGQNQGATFDELGLKQGGTAFRALVPGTAMLAVEAGGVGSQQEEQGGGHIERVRELAVCALPYHQTTLNPLDLKALRRGHERVPCPTELPLASPAHNYSLIHLKAANRAPSHEFALGMLHDCLTVAEAHALHELLRVAGSRTGAGKGATSSGGDAAAAARELRELRRQVAWAHGLGGLEKTRSEE